MTEDGSDPNTAIPADALAALASADVQKRAARMAQDAFAQVFRLTVEGDEDAARAGVADISTALANWSAAAGDKNAAALRLAMLVAGLDQWGVAWSRAFGLQSIPALSVLVGSLRTALDAQAEARLSQHFAAIDDGEGNVIDFKIELRREIHLALWHAMIACEDRDEAETLARGLGGMMVALVQGMPRLGWRLVADALSHIQIRCLSQQLATEGLAQETTQALFAALARELPADRRDLVFGQSARAVHAWQQAGRGTVH